MEDKPKDAESGSLESQSKNGLSPSDSPTANLQLDKRGLPLSPQPSSDPLDPLNWPPWLKYLVLSEVSFLSFLALFSAALIVSSRR